jgi:hypothetical protein
MIDLCAEAEAIGESMHEPVKPQIISLDPSMFSDRSVAICAGYCRLAMRTPQGDIPRDCTVFRRSITDGEWEWLQRELPLPQCFPQLWESLALADFLGHDNLTTLLAGYAATAFAGKTTAQMREFCGVPPNARDEELFSPETLQLMEDEEEWRTFEKK